MIINIKEQGTCKLFADVLTGDEIISVEPYQIISFMFKSAQKERQ